jgi:hypothetical protein
MTHRVPGVVHERFLQPCLPSGSDEIRPANFHQGLSPDGALFLEREFQARVVVWGKSGTARFDRREYP